MATHVAFSKPPFEYIVPIFIGNASKKNNDFGITDRAGINISLRNHIYGELTALYWIWKNTQDDMLGLCHYRRFFDITEPEIREALDGNGIILPPAFHLKWQVDQQFVRVHNERIWRQTLDVLYRQYPQYELLAPQVFSGNLLYRYNMFIGRRAFVETYCLFAFNILFELEKIVEMEQFNHYQQRYAGFVAERLLTLYVLGNNIPRMEKRIIDSACKDVSQRRGQRLLNDLYFRMLGK